jgi:hypothetical protein
MHGEGIRMTTQKSRTAEKRSPAPTHAINLLKADHTAVSALFGEFERTRSTARKVSIVQEICTASSVHAQIEEEIFYPAVRGAFKDKILVPEAIVEHASVKELVAQIEGIAPEGEMFDAKLKVLVRIREASRQGRAHGDVSQGQRNQAKHGGPRGTDGSKEASAAC